MNINRKFYRINYQITSPELRLLDETGKQIGIVSKIEALQKARELNLDVVEVASNAKPPVAKLIDYKKFKYQESKKDRESRKLSKKVGVKELRIRPFIGQHDFDTRVKQSKEFLTDGNQVKINVVFKGRELAHKEFGFDIIRKFQTALGNVKPVRDAHFEGKVLSATYIAQKKEK